MDDALVDMFRHHRHDVLNELQLVRAYLQMDKPDKALSIVDRAATWLQSLSRWHDISGENGRLLLLSAAVCPSVVLMSMSVEQQPLSSTVDDLRNWMVEAQTSLAQVGHRVDIRLHLDTTECRIYLKGSEVNELRTQMNNWQSFESLRFILVDGYIE